MKSCYIPYTVESNKYVKNIQEILNEGGIETYSFKECIKSPKLFKEVKVYNFNWFEGTKYKSLIPILLDYTLKMLLIYFLKLFNKKVVWTMHNRISHDTQHKKLSLMIIKCFCKKADYIVIHCTESKNVIKEIYPKINEEKVILIQHPNYIGNYVLSKKISRKSLNIDEKELVFLFFGSVMPYKNIELLITVFRELNYKNIKLLIVGRACNEEYKNRLINLAKETENIIFNLKFIPDDEVADYYQLSDIVILPYDNESMLNSGSVYLSFSLKRTVICPEIGTIKDVENEDIIYKYDYNSYSDHKSKIKEIVNNICNEYYKNGSKEFIKNKGNKCYEYIKNKCNKHEIEEKYVCMYSTVKGEEYEKLEI